MMSAKLVNVVKHDPGIHLLFATFSIPRLDNKHIYGTFSSHAHHVALYTCTVEKSEPLAS